MIKLFINLGLFLVAVHGTELHTSADANYEYQFLNISSTSRRITFKVKAANDVHIMLAGTTNPTGSDPYYEVVVGGWSDTKSVIRKDRNVEPKAEVSTVNIVSESEFRGFWIEYSKAKGRIAVGKAGEEEPFILWTDPQPIEVKVSGFATGFGAAGSWSINEEGCSGVNGCADDRTCASGVCLNPCRVKPYTCQDELFCEVKSHTESCFKPGNIQRLSTTSVNYDYIYFPAPTKGSVIKFKVKAANDAHFILTESKNPNVTTDNFLETVIGGWSNSYSRLRNRREGGDKDEEYFPGIIRDDQYRGFWVQYLDGTLKVGKENEKNPFLMWTATNPLNFKYFGVATGFGSTGQWILYN